jgi:hypothetical protein
MRKIISFAFLFGVIINSFGQIEPKHTFTMEVGMPIATANPFFKGVMKSIVNLSPYYQFRFKNSFTLGAGANYSYLQVDKFKVPTAEPAKGGVHTIGGFVKVGHEKFHNEQFATDFGVKIGYNKTYFNTDFNDSIYGKAQTVNSVSVTPMLGLILSVDEFSSYRFTIGYAFNGFGFSPQRLGIQTNAGYNVSEYSKPSQCLIIGFGFTHYFSKVKNTEE